eukprot:TRINITY_DN37450_c0_g1_i1.p1 TRINITY_DN37450_c0_g1~~TRINITY_DN37450_c0_g1_i1.p1  ORF type:complete len:315 (+),score=39.29 TRINITY_DN37450_c0_g1_i1:33-977(+)
MDRPSELQMSQYTIFIGNPGVGKSFLLNSLLQEQKFQSGVSYGEGLTQTLQLEQDSHTPNTFWGDTPGLSDINRRKKAAEEIEKAMKQNGYYRIVFVLTLESGRFRPDDILTMKLVLDVIPKQVPFGIIINKVSLRIYELWGQPENQKKVFQILFSKIRPTPFVTLLQEMDPETLSGNNNSNPTLLNNNANPTPPSMLDSENAETIHLWLSQIPFYQLLPAQVQFINCTTLDELRREIEEKIRYHESQNQVKEEEWKLLLASMEEQASLLHKALEQQQMTRTQLVHQLRKNQRSNFFRKIFEVGAPFVLKLLLL